MQFETFFTWLEGYYGKYERPILRSSVAAYVKAIPEPEIEPLKEYLKVNFSTQYGFTPDIGTIEVARKDINPIPKESGSICDKGHRYHGSFCRQCIKDEREAAAENDGGDEF